MESLKDEWKQYMSHEKAAEEKPDYGNKGGKLERGQAADGVTGGTAAGVTGAEAHEEATDDDDENSLQGKQAFPGVEIGYQGYGTRCVVHVGGEVAQGGNCCFRHVGDLCFGRGEVVSGNIPAEQCAEGYHEVPALRWPVEFEKIVEFIGAIGGAHNAQVGRHAKLFAKPDEQKHDKGN